MTFSVCVSARSFTRSASSLFEEQDLLEISRTDKAFESELCVLSGCSFEMDLNSSHTKCHNRGQFHFRDKYIHKTMSQLYVTHVLILRSFAL